MKIYNSFQELANAFQHNLAHSLQHNLETALDELGLATKLEMEERIGHYPQTMGRSPAFASLAQSTVEQKEKKGWGLNGNANSPLYATGLFARSIGTNRSGHKFVVIGSNVKSVQYTEYGTARMPARPVMLPSAEYVIRRYRTRLQQLSAAGLVSHIVNPRMVTK